MFKFVQKHSQPIGGPPTYRHPIFAHSMEVQTFTTDRRAPTLAMPVTVVSNVVRHSYLYTILLYTTFPHDFAILYYYHLFL